MKWTMMFHRLTMPAFGEVLSPAEIRAVIAYLRTLWTPEQRRFQWEESRKEPLPPEAGVQAGATAEDDPEGGRSQHGRG